MNANFIITKIENIIYVDKNQYPEKVTAFCGNLPNCELIYHISGKMSIYFNGKTEMCDDNTLRFLPKGENRGYTVTREENGDCIDIFFDTDKPISSEMFTIKLNNGTAAAPIFKKIFSLWVAKCDGYYFECISLLYKVFAMLQKQTYLPEKQYKKIKPAIDYINENFTNGKLSVGKLSAICGISESALKKLFIKKFGVPPVRYIIQLKINYSCDLLRSGLYSVSRVSQICGYGNVYFFSRQFKENMGISPSEFIKKYKSSK